jgi:hypothetical protein
MRIQMKTWTPFVAALLLAEGPAVAADSVPVSKDLTSVIALMGMPCGEVVSAQRQGENDYLATCKDGNRYRVYTNAQGRVVAEKR